MTEHKPGQIVFGRYALKKLVAKGGMGGVWVATDRKLQREVALKLLASSFLRSERARKRFEREAMSVARLQSPHVVQIFDYGVDQRTPFIVMELLSGEDLRDRVKRERRLPLPQVAAITTQVARGLAEAHAAGLVHRDLKPANIFLAATRSGELAKVLDFGVAKPEEGQEVDAEELTSQGALVGTPQYMSPEQIRALPDVDARADVWALAVVVYRATVGRLPFRGRTSADLSVNVCGGIFPKPTEVCDDLPFELDRFFERALQVDRDKRFQTPTELAAAFAGIALDGPLSHAGGSISGPGSQGGFVDPMSLPGFSQPGVSRPGSPSSFPGAPHSYPSSAGPVSGASLAGITGTTDVGTIPGTSLSDPTYSGATGAGVVAPGARKKPLVPIVAAVVVLLVLLLVGGGLLIGGGEPAPTAAASAPPTVAAAPPPASVEAAPATSAPAATPSATATASATASAAAPKPKPKPKPKPRPKPRPKPKPGGEPWDPFAGRN